MTDVATRAGDAGFGRHAQPITMRRRDVQMRRLTASHPTLATICRILLVATLD